MSVASSANNCTLESGCTAIEPLLTKKKQIISHPEKQETYILLNQRSRKQFHIFSTL
jgi:hypothetical protein